MDILLIRHNNFIDAKPVDKDCHHGIDNKAALQNTHVHVLFKIVIGK